MALTQNFVFGIIRKVESGLKIKEFERGHPIQQNPLNSWNSICHAICVDPENKCHRTKKNI